jgi:hypothetical protein
MAEEKFRIPKPRGHNCFACGTDNPIGLNLQFYRLADDVCTEITLDKQYEGWEGVIHGGIVSTLLDEVMRAEIRDEQGRLLVRSSAEFVEIPGMNKGDCW